MGLMICENAGECTSPNCLHKYAHNKDDCCNLGCMSKKVGSKCIPYIEPAKDALTDHPKYCRLSNQAGSLCGLHDNDLCRVHIATSNDIHLDWTTCPRPEKQQPVEIPKDPLEELCRKQALKQFGETDQTLGDLSEMFREFAEKVKALNG